jgi:predicted CoA-binding protein
MNKIASFLLCIQRMGAVVEPGRIITNESLIKEILNASRIIAVLGLSPKPDRDSFRVAKYLKENGYKIIPIRPGQKEILGEAVFKSLDDIDPPVDIIDVFRKPDQIMDHAKEAIRLRPKVFWMQLNIENHDAALFLNANGIDVIMNRCIKVDHERLFKKIPLQEQETKKL